MVLLSTTGAVGEGGGYSRSGLKAHLEGRMIKRDNSDSPS